VISTALAANYVLFVAGDERAQEPGTFFEYLTRAAFHADHRNRTLLGKGFPEIARAVTMYKDQEDGYILLEQEAGLRPLGPREGET
jgi:hypothetical protein